ncbi:MAG: hypothetical protein M1459_00765 [Patescibacteria group bacterium]|nr:hypothetical protein [Patescibacteria group bacterium]
MGLLKWKDDVAKASDAMDALAKEYTKPSYKKVEFWLSIIAIVISIIALCK